jgi:hypothetical protein
MAFLCPWCESDLKQVGESQLYKCETLCTLEVNVNAEGDGNVATVKVTTDEKTHPKGDERAM